MFQIVVTNELTTRVINEDETYITPALGDSFSHRTNVQIALGKDLDNNELFYASIDKSFYTKEIIVPFKVCILLDRFLGCSEFTFLRYISILCANYLFN